MDRKSSPGSSEAMRMLLALLLAFTVSCASMPVLQHSGGTDSNGCHTNSRTGDRHCHGFGSGGGSGSGSGGGNQAAYIVTLSLVAIGLALLTWYFIWGPGAQPAPKTAKAK